MSLLLFDAAPLAEPYRTIFVVAVLIGIVAIPLGLALWRLQSRNRPHHLRLPYSDRDALIYQVTKVLSLVGFSQGPAAGQTILFQPNAAQSFALPQGALSAGQGLRRADRAPPYWP